MRFISDSWLVFIILKISSTWAWVRDFFAWDDEIFRIGIYLLNIYGLKYCNKEFTTFLRFIIYITAGRDKAVSFCYFYNIFLSITKDLSFVSKGDCLHITVNIY